MKPGIIFFRGPALVFGGLLFYALMLTSMAVAGPFQLASDGGEQPPRRGAHGDSVLPVVSAGGEFVAFASTAPNALNDTNQQVRITHVPPVYNVYLRNRTNSTTTLVSISTDATGGATEDAFPAAVSDDGRFVLFESAAGNLVPGDTNGVTDIFLRDTQDGVTHWVSVPVKSSGFSISEAAVMSGDARRVAFASLGSNLVLNDTNYLQDVFVRDLQQGTTEHASRYAYLPLQFTRRSNAPEISRDGRYVAFFSNATGLVPGVNTNGQIFVRDTTTGTIVCVSSNALQVFLETRQTSGQCFNHAISADGRFVAFACTSLAPQTNSAMVFRYELQTGITDVLHNGAVLRRGSAGYFSDLEISEDGRYVTFLAYADDPPGSAVSIVRWDGQTRVTEVASLGTDGLTVTNGLFEWPAMSGDGRFIAFMSDATNLVTPELPGTQLYLRDMQQGTTARLSGAPPFESARISNLRSPSISAHGEFVVYEVLGLDPAASGTAADVIAFSRVAGTNELISVPGSLINLRGTGGFVYTSDACVSADGRCVVFTGTRDIAEMGDTNGMMDVFLKDLAATNLVLISQAGDGRAGSGHSFRPVISGDGTAIAFTSYATNLAGTADTNKVADVFVRLAGEAAPRVVSRKFSANEAATGGTSYDPQISTDGKRIAFMSTATDLINFKPLLPPGEKTNVYMYDVQTGTNWAITTNSAVRYSMTPDGRFVAVVGLAFLGSTPYFHFFDDRGRVVFKDTSKKAEAAVISPDGKRAAWMVFQTTYELRSCETNTQAVTVIDSGTRLPKRALSFSLDGRMLAFCKPMADGTDALWLHDFATATQTLVSRAWNNAGHAMGGNSGPAQFSPDGRFLVYRSTATNIVAQDLNPGPDVYLWDSVTGANSLLNRSRWGAQSIAYGGALAGDGQSVVFSAMDGGLTAEDGSPGFKIISRALPMFGYLRGPEGIDALYWASSPGAGRQVLAADSLDAAAWLPASGTTTNLANKTWWVPAGPQPASRFYQVIMEDEP